MPKLIDYPRTSYSGAWELAEVVDDTGGKCEIETAARKLNRKVSGSFKAIIGSAVKFGLLTSKREMLSVTTLYKRIKHAYDKKEELLFHREAFLTPPLFTQICRKFRLRELPVQMLDVMLIREFGVEEINAQGVAKAFVEGCRMVNLLDERNTMADIDASAGQLSPRREISSVPLAQNSFQPAPAQKNAEPSDQPQEDPFLHEVPTEHEPKNNYTGNAKADAVANLFGLFQNSEETHNRPNLPSTPTIAEKETEEGSASILPVDNTVNSRPAYQEPNYPQPMPTSNSTTVYQLQISGPGLNSTLAILEEEDIVIAQALLEKIRRQLKAREL